MKVLIACEESQTVCKAFRELGHDAYSCDIRAPSGGHPEWHIRENVLSVLRPYQNIITFTTCDGKLHSISAWDMVIAHPPCTYLSAAGAVWLFDKDHNIKDAKRHENGIQAARFFYRFLSLPYRYVAVENPVPLKIYGLPKYDQIIEPYYFGDPWKKKTCLWLKGLPPLVKTNEVHPIGYWVGAHGKDKAPYGMIKGFRDQKTRSKTFPGIAKAMAEQWTEYIENKDGVIK